MSRSYLRKVKSPTGKIHYAEVAHKEKGVEIFDPYCNHRNWIGDYWGKKWVSVTDDTEVTCKNCLSARGELPCKVEIISRSHRTNQEIKIVKKFRTNGEVAAYVQGLKDAIVWEHTTIMANNEII